MKRFVKCGISLVVFVATMIGRFLARLVGVTPAGSCVVLYYHSVPESQLEKFARQLDALMRNATPIAVDKSVVVAKGARLAAVTFDDGFENFFQHAMPELEKRRIPVAMFVIADALGKAFGPLGRAEQVMSLAQLRALPVDLVTIGSHTSTHPFLPSTKEEDMLRELAGSRAKLEKLLGRKIELFSFPFGGFSERLIELCRAAGYRRVFTTLPAYGFAASNEFAVGRVRVDPTDWPLEFHLKVAGAYRWLPYAFRLKRTITTSWLVHKVFGSLQTAPQGAAPQSMIRELSTR